MSCRSSRPVQPALPLQPVQPTLPPPPVQTTQVAQATQTAQLVRSTCPYPVPDPSFTPDRSTLFVVPQGNDALNKMGIRKMTSKRIRELRHGKEVMVYALLDGKAAFSPAINHRVTLRSLTAFSPVVLKALNRHNEASNARIDNVVLPPGNSMAYIKIFGWIYACIQEGRVARFNKVYKRPYQMYQDIAIIAGTLGIGQLLDDMRYRLSHMANPAPGAPVWVAPDNNS